MARKLTPEEQEMRDFEYQESLAGVNTPQVDLGKIEVNKTPTGGYTLENYLKELLNQSSQQRGFVQGVKDFGSSLATAAAQAPVNMQNRGWESNLGATLGAKVGSGLINTALFGSTAGKEMAIRAQPELYNTLSERQKGQASLNRAILLKTMFPPVGQQLREAALANQKASALNIIKNKSIVNPTTLEETPLPREDEMRSALSYLSLRYPGVNPSDPDLAAALKASYAQKKTMGFGQRIKSFFGGGPKTAKGKMIYQRALEEGLNEDEILAAIADLEQSLETQYLEE